MTAGEVSLSTEIVRSSWAPACGTGSGTAIRPACNAPRNPTTYSILRCQYHCPITGRPHMPERLGDIEHSPIQLRPGQGFGNTGPVLLVIDVGDGRTIGVHTGARAARWESKTRPRQHTTSNASSTLTVSPDGDSASTTNLALVAAKRDGAGAVQPHRRRNSRRVDP